MTTAPDKDGAVILEATPKLETTASFQLQSPSSHFNVVLVLPGPLQWGLATKSGPNSLRFPSISAVSLKDVLFSGFPNAFAWRIAWSPVFPTGPATVQSRLKLQSFKGRLVRSQQRPPKKGSPLESTFFSARQCEEFSGGEYLPGPTSQIFQKFSGSVLERSRVCFIGLEDIGFQG